jgi:hypothetical protein
MTSSNMAVVTRLGLIAYDAALDQVPKRIPSTGLWGGCVLGTMRLHPIISVVLLDGFIVSLWSLEHQIRLLTCVVTA